MALAIMTAHFFELTMFLIIVLIHELGHAFAASFYSWRIKRISLLPFGGVAEMDEHGNRPLKEEAIVTLAGPLQHVWMIGGLYSFIISTGYPRIFTSNLLNLTRWSLCLICYRFGRLMVENFCIFGDHYTNPLW